ncbi:hypothetical protein AGOR_G00155780 [Albula goreensis]|uniref:Uncharacterized protein n=1 Tax=Albula goreensis TaxID=1534307 RepID=A0A8T3D4J9_9TELE|nr:hypothetical protein AGOR_G00155780 [Albula goreensis]
MATSQRRMNGSWSRLALTLLFCILIFHNVALAQDEAQTTQEGVSDDSVVTGPPLLVEIAARGDGDPIPDPASTDAALDQDPADIQTTDDTTGTDDDMTDTGATGEAGVPAADPDGVDPTPKDDEPVQTAEAVTVVPQISMDSITHIFNLFDNPTAWSPIDFGTKVIVDDVSITTSKQGDIQCVDKDAVEDRDAVKLHLMGTSRCEDTKAKMEDLLGDICGKDCKLNIFQEVDSSHVIVSGQDVEANAKAMTEKFTSEGIKDKLGVVEAAPRWGKHPPTVLVSLLLTGLLLAALLIGGYCLRNHRGQKAKGMRLADESFQVDEENQGNTLVSVAPLHPQEPQEKPSVNGESPEGVKTEAPPTNGSTTKTPVADTEL